MSDVIYVGPEKSSRWAVDPAQFRRDLLERWPDAEISDATDSKRVVLEFELPPHPGGVTAELLRDRPALMIDYGPREQIAELVAWFRSLAPPAESFVVWSGSGVACTLRPGATAQDFLRDFRLGQFKPAHRT